MTNGGGISIQDNKHLSHFAVYLDAKLQLQSVATKGKKNNGNKPAHFHL